MSALAFSICWAFFLSMGHVAFLFGIAMRLIHIGYPGAKVTSLCFTSFLAWPVLLLAGQVTHMSVLMAYAGLSVVLVATLGYYLYLELYVLLENPAEQQSRLALKNGEIARHEDAVQQNDEFIAHLFPIKSYVGDAYHLQAISDLGKLKDAGIRCRIEGSMVKVLYVDHALITKVEQLITVPSAPAEDLAQDGATSSA